MYKRQTYSIHYALWHNVPTNDGSHADPQRNPFSVLSANPVSYTHLIDKSIQFIQNTPIQLLRDSVVTLPCGIQLIGRDDRSNARRLPLQKLMARIDKSKPVILLDHQPYQLAESQAAGIDLQLSLIHISRTFPMHKLTELCYK